MRNVEWLQTRRVGSMGKVLVKQKRNQRRLTIFNPFFPRDSRVQSGIMNFRRKISRNEWPVDVKRRSTAPATPFRSKTDFLSQLLQPLTLFHSRAQFPHFDRHWTPRGCESSLRIWAVKSRIAIEKIKVVVVNVNGEKPRADIKQNGRGGLRKYQRSVSFKRIKGLRDRDLFNPPRRRSPRWCRQMPRG